MLVGLVCFVFGVGCGVGLQWLAFEKELAFWNIETEQAQLRVRIDKLESQDLQQLMEALERSGKQIRHALLVLGYTEEEVKDGTR